MEDEMEFLDDESIGASTPLPPWHILVVDDEPGVHEVTRMILRDFQFDGRGVKLEHAYSAGEAERILAARKDIAVVLLDVVMETETAGLDLTRRIRGELRNQQVRIILRTGQPSTLSENEVLRSYDVNDYRQKTELTMQKLLGACILALRGYRDVTRSLASPLAA